jgi:DNA gyrase subunit A
LRFRKEVVTRRTQFDLEKAREREHIFEGLKTAVDHLDAVITLIRGAADPESARTGLMTQFGLSDIQARAILEIRLQRLTGLERQKIIDELVSVRKLIAELENILAHDEVKMKIIRDELTLIHEKYGDDRRTQIVEAEGGEIEMEDLIADEEVVVTCSRGGFIKRQGMDNYRSQRRGGKGIKGMEVREEDVVEHLFVASTLSYLLLFTNFGKVHWLKVYQIPDASRISKGKSIANLLPLQPEERLAGILSVREFQENQFVLSVSRSGVVKKTDLMAYSNPRQGGIIGLTLDDGDHLIAAKLCAPGKDILLATKNGMSIRFNEGEARAMGRTARGVRGIRLRDGDQVVGAEIVEAGKTLLTATENGYGKRTGLEEYPVQGRDGVGVIDIKCNDKIGSVIGIQQISDTDELLVITSDGNIVRIKVSEVSVIGRNTQGVRLVALDEGSRVVCVEKVVD